MKKSSAYLLYSFIFLGLSLNILKGQIAISIKPENENLPDASTILDMDFPENKNLGILIPTVNLLSYTDATTISNPANYLLAFSTNTDTNGLNVWNPNNAPASWDNLITYLKLNQIISTSKIPQVILSAYQSTAETTDHVTDANNSTPYKIKMDYVDLDSQSGYSTTNYAYTIPADGIYEITCNTTITPTNQNYSSQTFIGINNAYNINSLLSSTVSNQPNPNEITTIDSYTQGTVITCGVGSGAWNSQRFKVISGTIKIVKY
ncbi:hypothetical protein [Apibacter sp. HY039]|uniref:hypothetical protein n=1 Tax=Apibacter sp. HY039 TaxID=2501476 RepID=UPI000FEBC56F|nr:hypothetical protein [Apibacter sp. HY039]